MVDLKHAISYIPFVGAAIVDQNVSEIQIGPLISRLLEYGIIAGFLMYTNVAVMDTKLDHFNAEIKRITTENTELRRELREMNTKLNILVGKVGGGP